MATATPPAATPSPRPRPSPPARGTRASLTAALPASPTVGQTARRYVRCLLEGTGRDDLLDDALTVATELASNAAEHGTGPLLLRLRLRGERLRIAVRDSCTSRWPRITGDLDDWTVERGRGLVMLSVLTRGWHARPVTGGKEVSALL